MSKLNHINNLYRPEAQHILLFKECWALEKIHGTAASVNFRPSDNTLAFHAGGESHTKFVSLFNQEQLLQKFKDMGIPQDKEVICFGEAYGGSQQGMSHTYGPSLKFVCFGVSIGDDFLSVPNADDFAKKLGFEFVDYVKISTELSALDAERDKHSVQAIRNGVTIVNADGTLTNPRKREGVILLPLVEMTLANGERVICKHKGADFQETATPRPVVDPSKMKVLEDAIAVATEWVTKNRLENVLGKMPGHSIEKMKDIIQAMTDDIFREGKGEFVESDAVKKAINKKTVEMYKNFIKK